MQDYLDGGPGPNQQQSEYNPASPTISLPTADIAPRAAGESPTPEISLQQIVRREDDYLKTKAALLLELAQDDDSDKSSVAGKSARGEKSPDQLGGGKSASPTAGGEKSATAFMMSNNSHNEPLIPSSGRKVSLTDTSLISPNNLHEGLVSGLSPKSRPGSPSGPATPHSSAAGFERVAIAIHSPPSTTTEGTHVADDVCRMPPPAAKLIDFLFGREKAQKWWVLLGNLADPKSFGAFFLDVYKL